MLSSEGPTDLFRTMVLQARERLQTAQSYIREVRDLTNADEDILRDVALLARDLRAVVRQRLLDAEEDDI
jgi:uncharacterized protein YjiS (DUF1127 family)